ncbi:hypothetical protein DXT63_08410 [Thermoanaerobacteraceae bacterium SP2]|nr:hypothetical protein DXT63_08410 [Thermoanaerobacteraceae bacterium SP2]
MATFTPNLNLKKPDGGENVNIADINGNMDVIDSRFAGGVIIKDNLGTSWRLGIQNGKVFFEEVV